MTTPTGTPTATALVLTDRPERYAKQLVSHMSRRCETTWDDDSRSGTILIGEDKALTEVRPRRDGLELTLHAEGDALERYEHVIGIHLARFGAKDGLVVSWVNEDGSPGPSQGPIDPSEPHEVSRPAPTDPSMEDA